MKKILNIIGIIIFFNCVASQRLEQYNVDPSSITVSGFSSGAGMSNQFHFAHSNEIVGAAIFAGVPELCGRTGFYYGFTTCMKNPTKVNVTALIPLINLLSDNELIDPVGNIQGDKVFIFHGTKDTTVFPASGPKVEELYTNYGADIQTEFSIDIGHTFPTTENSGYDGAFKMLSHFYGELTSPADGDSGNLENLLSFDQKEFFDQNPKVSGVGDSGFIYVPTRCRDGSVTCRLHITFHGCSGCSGCRYSGILIGNKYATALGLLELAEANNIIVLFPQTTPTSKNQNGCWDWFGYTDKWFPTKKGVQILGIYRMMTRIVSG